MENWTNVWYVHISNAYFQKMFRYHCIVISLPTVMHFCFELNTEIHFRHDASIYCLNLFFFYICKLKHFIESFYIFENLKTIIFFYYKIMQLFREMERGGSIQHQIILNLMFLRWLYVRILHREYLILLKHTQNSYCKFDNIESVILMS